MKKTEDVDAWDDIIIITTIKIKLVKGGANFAATIVKIMTALWRARGGRDTDEDGLDNLFYGII